jgi:hypothetical protein
MYTEYAYIHTVVGTADQCKQTVRPEGGTLHTDRPSTMQHQQQTSVFKVKVIAETEREREICTIRVTERQT